MSRDQIPEQFNFHVEMEPDYSLDIDEDIYEYTVSLGHQCDGWYVVSTTDKAHALRRLDEFINAAIDAKVKLERMP